MEPPTFYARLERLTRQWWFYLLLFLVPAIIPPYASTGFGYLKHLNDFIWYVSGEMYAKKFDYASYMPILHLIVVLAILLLVAFKSKMGRAFSFFAGINGFIMIFYQAYVVTEKYGLAIISELFVWYLIVIAAWFWEAVISRTEYTFRNLKPKHLWLIPLVLLAFWDPEGLWNFDPKFFITSFAPSAFCTMAPIYLALLAFQFPRVNLPLIRIVSFTGLIMSVITIGVAFLKDLSGAAYWVLLHTPLMVISLYCFLLSFGQRPDKRAAGSFAQS